MTWDKRDQGDGFRDQAWMVIRRIAALDQPKLVGLHRGLAVAHTSFRHYGTGTSLSAQAILSSTVA